MTTESSTIRRATNAGPLLGAASAAAATGLLIAAVATLAGGGGAGLAALVGAGVTLGVLAFGAFAVDLVATVMPGASLLFALLTYALQLLLMLVVLAAIDRSEVFSATVAARSLGVAAIGVALAWTAAQLRLATRRRIPVYDLPVPSTTAGER